MELQVHVSKVYPVAEFDTKSGNKFRKQEFAGETVETYPKKVFFALYGKYIDDQKVHEGCTYKVCFDIESRNFISKSGQERWSTELKAYNLIWEKSDGQEGPVNVQQPAQPQYQPQPVQVGNAEPAPENQQPQHSEDLPF